MAACGDGKAIAIKFLFTLNYSVQSVHLYYSPCVCFLRLGELAGAGCSLFFGGMRFLVVDLISLRHFYQLSNNTYFTIDLPFPVHFQYANNSR